MTEKAHKGDKIQLKNQEVEVVTCEREDCEHLMVNIDADQLEKGDLAILKAAGVRISNPETDAPICVGCEHRSFGRRVADWFEDESDDDDSSFFGSVGGISGGIGSFGGGSSFGGFGGGFGGFGGGGFGGGGASRGF